MVGTTTEESNFWHRDDWDWLKDAESTVEEEA